MLPYLAFLVFLSVCCSAADIGPRATIDAGVVVGTTTLLPSATAVVNRFLGIPFAVSPPERFSPPRKSEKFNETIVAQQLSAACIQSFRGTAEEREVLELVFNNPGGSPPPESEDCLYLNVYAAQSEPPRGGRAVLAWIHGGSLQAGSAVYDHSDGSSFAASQDVIIVSFNYRTNVFGFPSSPELASDAQNLGFLDQRLALDWIQTNIAAFGGDPEKVTVFGESSGGQSVDVLITTFGNGTSPPFRGGILQSGQASYQFAPLADSTPAWRQLSQELGCCGSLRSCNATLDCVRRASADDIRNIIQRKSLTFDPVADNITYVSDPQERRAIGNIARIPVMGGSNSVEGQTYAVGVEDAELALQELGLQDPALFNALLDSVPIGEDGIETPSDQLSQIITEVVFQCPMASFINATAAIGVPVWRYYFDASFANTQPIPDVNVGAFHSSEIPMVFGTYPKGNATKQQRQLSEAMQAAWAAFAKDPNAGPGWSQFDEIGAVKEAQLEGDSGKVAVLSTGRTLHKGFSVVDSSDLDRRCSLYASIISS